MMDSTEPCAHIEECRIPNVIRRHDLTKGFDEQPRCLVWSSTPIPPEHLGDGRIVELFSDSRALRTGHSVPSRLKA
jgi:hypothetical protein